MFLFKSGNSWRYRLRLAGLVLIVVIAALVLTALGQSIQAAKYNADPVFSDDGSQIAFVCYDLTFFNLLANLTKSPDGEIPYNRSFKEICVVSPDGGDYQKITHDSAADRSPQWRPGENQVSFITEAGPNAFLKLFNIDDASTTLLPMTSGIIDYAWMPGGDSILFVAGWGRKSKISILDLTTHVERILAEDGHFYSLGSSPDGRNISYMENASENCKLHIYDLTEQQDVELEPATVCLSLLAWAPDGTQLAFASPGTENRLSIYSLPEQKIYQTEMPFDPIVSDLAWYDEDHILGVYLRYLVEYDLVEKVWQPVARSAGDNHFSTGEVLSVDSRKRVVVSMVSDDYKSSTIWLEKLVGAGSFEVTK